MTVTTPARTALDIACRYPLGKAVAAIDALARATQVKMADVELQADRYRGRRGIRNARKVVDLVDPGAESPRETWLRLLVIRNGFPRPQTQIPVYDRYGALVAVLDMGCEEIKVAADYEGEHHGDPVQFYKDIHRHDDVTDLWVDRHPRYVAGHRVRNRCTVISGIRAPNVKTQRKIDQFAA